MPYISDETILDVQRAVDIVDIVSQYLPLKRSGSNYKALCPFHDEKSPSFMVSAEKQIYKCFGCQKGGGVINFVMAMEKLTFPESVQLLAEKAGITVKTLGRQEAGPNRDFLYKINEWAAVYFQGLLKSSPQAQPARAYLEKRAVNKEMIELFRLGYSLNTWDSLLNKAKQDGFSEAQMYEAGLIVHGEKSSYDKFRGRLMFPIEDIRGKVVGFGGRNLDQAEPKYLNTPETPIFRKGSLFYGLDKVKGDLEDGGVAYVVEGYFDMIMPYQHGIKGLVASMGTAMTSEHVRLLKRYVSKVVLVYDGDSAGAKAAERSLDRLLSEDIDIRVAQLPSGMDPFDCIVKKGKDEFLKALQGSTEIFDFLVQALTKKIDTSTSAGQSRLIEEILSRVAIVPSEIRQTVLLQRLSDVFKIDERVFRSELVKLGAAAGPRGEDRKPEAPVGKPDRREQSACDLIEAMIFRPSVVPLVRQNRPADRFPTERSKKIVQKIYDQYDQTGKVDVSVLSALFPDDASWIAGIVSEEREDDKVEKRVLVYLEDMRQMDIKEDRNRVLNRIKDVKASGDDKGMDKLLKELETLKKS